jgi:histidinol-phosphate phosphatase family protein
LDRDGTLLKERGYLSDPKRLRFYPRVFEALRYLQKAELRLVVITNQSGVGRGYFSLKTLKLIHHVFLKKLASKGVRISRVYYCPHRPNKGCSCRKPRTGLALRAARALGLDLPSCYLVGDQLIDIQLAERVKAKSVFVLTGAGRSERSRVLNKATKISRNLLTAAKWIVSDHRRRRDL